MLLSCGLFVFGAALKATDIQFEMGVAFFLVDFPEKFAINQVSLCVLLANVHYLLGGIVLSLSQSVHAGSNFK